MNRRQFLALGAGGAILIPGFEGSLPAQPQAARNPSGRPAIPGLPDLLSRALSAPVTSLPTIQPIFGGVFVPGGNSTQLIGANGFTSLNTQVQNLAAQGFRISSLTAIQNMNSTWYYAALTPGSANYLLVHTSYPAVFQQAFTTNQSGYRLVDFAITWEQGALTCVGYWIAVTAPANQTLVWAVDVTDLITQTNTLSGQGLRVTRIEAFPQQDSSRFSAVFQPGTGNWAWQRTALRSFPAAVAAHTGVSLSGLSYDQASGSIVGCFGASINSAQFVWNQDWNTLQATAQQMAANGLTLVAIAAYPNAPDFDSFFAANLAPFVMGYSYAVGYNGQIAAKGYGLARGPHETSKPSTSFAPAVRCNLYSVSKALTGVALQAMLLRYPSITLDTPFWPLIAGQVPNPDPSIKVVTLRNLATHKSGMQLTPAVENGNDEGTQYGNLWPYLNQYLALPLIGTPGVTYFYNNENFTILQGVIDQVTGMDYVKWVTQNVLIPAGIDPSIFNATPDPQTSATLQYSGPNDTAPGYYPGVIDFVAPGGWVSTASELLKMLLALRNTSVLPAETISDMLTGGIGWFSTVTSYGTCYWKNGGNLLTTKQGLNSCVIRFPEGYDIALVANSQPPADVVTLCIDAFNSRGLLTSDAPPAIAAIVGAATFLPKAAPSTYCSITGSGFTDQAATDWAASITGSALPTAVGGISVSVNGQPAYVQYVSSSRVNFLLPENVATGVANVDLVTPNGVMTSTLEIDAATPGLFTYSLNGAIHPLSVFATDTGAVYVAPAGALPGYSSRPAAPGDIVELYATGCGATSPAAPDGVVLPTVYPAADLSAFEVTIGGKAATVLSANLVNPGLWQLRIQIPSGLVGGDQPLVLSVNGVTSQPNVTIALLGG